MAKAFFPTNDGHVGNLEKLSTVEIRELLKRQEDILKKKSFVARLPDKGDKLRSHIVSLRKTLTDRDKPAVTDTEIVTLTRSNGIDLPNESVNSHIDVDDDTQSDHMSHSGNSLENCLDKLSISGNGGIEKNAAHSTVPKHYYEVALERNAENLQAGLRQPMKLNRDLKIHHVKDLPSDIMRDKPAKPDTCNSKCTTNRIKVPEESAVIPPQYKYSSTQTIQLQESLWLQQEQKETQEKLNAEIAAQKLAERLHIKTEEYNPEGVDMSYRNSSRGGGHLDDVDSDDDDDQNDANNDPLMTVPSDTED